MNQSLDAAERSVSIIKSGAMPNEIWMLGSPKQRCDRISPSSCSCGSVVIRRVWRLFCTMQLLQLLTIEMKNGNTLGHFEADFKEKGCRMRIEGYIVAVQRQD